jgi:hypothetical protein
MFEAKYIGEHPAPPHMSRNYQDLIEKLLKIREDYHNTVLKYVNTFKHNDARLSLFSKCINVLDGTFLGLYFYNFHLTEPEMWEDISFRLQVRLPPEDDILSHVDAFAMFVKIGFIQLMHSAIESSMRLIIEIYNNQEYIKRVSSFTRIYTWFFEDAKLMSYKPVLDMLSTLRDINHDNGAYYGKNKQITIDGHNYIFENRRSVQFVTWDLLLNLMPQLKNMLIDIVELTKRIRVDIIDSSIE